MPKLKAFTKGHRRRLISYGLLSVVGATMIAPLCWMVSTSLKAPSASMLDLSSLVPKRPTVLAQDDVLDYPKLCRQLVSAASGNGRTIHRQIWDKLPPRVQRTVSRVAGKASSHENERLIIRDALNELVTGSPLADLEDVGQLGLDEEARTLLQQTANLQNDEARHRANRLILESCFPAELDHLSRLRWKNYRTAWVEANVARAFFNSMIVSGAIVAGQLVTSSLAAFAFARLRFVGRDKVFLCYLATMMVPSAVTMIPVFILLRHLHWVNTYQALIIPSIFTAYGTFMLRQFFLGIPRELEEAAMLDGCGTFRIYWHVALPLSKAGLAALGILSFIAEWKSFMWPLIVTHTQDMFTLPVALVQFQDRFGIQWTLLLAASVLMIVPMLIVFIAGQRFFVAGVRLGASKE